MPNKKTLTLMGAILIAVCGFLIAAVPAFAASKEKVLYSFCSVSGCPDGAYPWFAGVISDPAGNLYGTTTSGGAYGYGTVFELTLGTNGRWAEKVLYSFCALPGCADGSGPDGLIFDAAGNLYGTTGGGGAYGSNCGGVGCGTVYELTQGTWTEKVLYSFNGNDGEDPFSPLVFDAAGNLYGTTPIGGYQDGGTVFELMPGKNGTWTGKKLHVFSTHGTDGYDPQGALVIDAAGDLYGTTVSGGTGHCGGYRAGCGTVFELIPGKEGSWTEKVVYSFDWEDGARPNAGLIFDSKGNLYGTTLLGRNKDCNDLSCGLIFELMPGRGGTWQEKVLHVFHGNGVDGYNPYSPLIFGRAGNLYGTTYSGGAYGYGTVFRLVLGSTGKWTETILHSFQHNGTDAVQPFAGLTLGVSGLLYGTGAYGGDYLEGAVFEITP